MLTIIYCKAFGCFEFLRGLLEVINWTTIGINVLELMLQYIETNLCFLLCTVHCLYSGNCGRSSCSTPLKNYCQGLPFIAVFSDNVYFVLKKCILLFSKFPVFLSGTKSLCVQRMNKTKKQYTKLRLGMLF